MQMPCQPHSSRPEAGAGACLPARRQVVAGSPPDLYRPGLQILYQILYRRPLSASGTPIALQERHKRIAGMTETAMNINPFSDREQALALRELRTEMLTTNIANADTPNYKARDFDFASVLRDSGVDKPQLRRTSTLHQPATPANPLGVEARYRVPVQPTLDGNTVEMDVEQAAFAQNAIRYRASLSFLDSQIRGLRFAIKGGD